jgi:hypothetical protein
MRRIFFALFCAFCALSAAAVVPAPPPASVEQWDVFEFTLPGPAEGNPFVEVELTARFTQGERTLTARGFYDGDGVYKVRFMPEAVGVWNYTTESNRSELQNKTGAFTATAPSKGNHGPVHVHKTFHFAYADGTPFRELGTTCYAWTHQGNELEERTLKTLASAPFNKIRFCVFPKHFDWNNN